MFLFSKNSINLLVLLDEDFLKGNPSTGLYSIKLTLQGTFLQNFARRSASSIESLTPSNKMYSYVILVPVFSKKYFTDSLSLSKSID